MADFYSSQVAGLIAEPKVFAPSTQLHGKMRIFKFDYTQAAAGAANDRIILAVLPKGRIHVLLWHSLLAYGAFGASRVMAVGWDAYDQVDSLGTNPVAADQAGFASAIDVASAGSLDRDSWNGGSLPLDKAWEFRSRDGVTISAQITGGTIPADLKINGYLTYTCE